LRVKLTPIQSGEEENTSRLLVSFVRCNGPGGLATQYSSGAAMPNDSVAEPGLPGWPETLRLTIEELEASREELQVLNKELRAVNDQLNLSNEEINDANARLRAKIQEMETQSHVLSSGAVMTVFLDKELRVRWFTPAISELFPLRPYDTGRQITELGPRFVDPHFLGDAQAVMRTGEPLEGEVRTVEGRWYLRRIGPFRIGNDKIIGVAVTFTDISERKRAEARLRQTLAKAEQGDRMLAALMEHLPEGIVIADAPDVKIRMISRAGREKTGKPDRQLKVAYGRLAERWGVYRADGVTRPADNELPLVRSIQNHETVRDEVWIIEHKDGRRIPVLCNASPIRDARGKITGGVIAFRDITARQQAEDAWRENDRLLKTLFEAMEEGFCIIEMIFDADNKPVDYRVLKANAAFERQTGLAGAEGKTMRSLKPHHEERWFEIYGRIALTGEPMRFEMPAAELGRDYSVYAFRIGEPERRKVGVLFRALAERELRAQTGIR
jgi:PAS domain-containing protein